MNADVIRESVVQSIARITGIPTNQISDTASLQDEIGLDSLSMLEIAVDAEMSFRIKVPDERLADIKTVSDAVRVIAEFLPVAAPA